MVALRGPALCLLAENSAGAQPAVAPLASARWWKGAVAQADGVDSVIQALTLEWPKRRKRLAEAS